MADDHNLSWTGVLDAHAVPVASPPIDTAIGSLVHSDCLRTVRRVSQAKVLRVRIIGRRQSTVLDVKLGESPSYLVVPCCGWMETILLEQENVVAELKAIRKLLIAIWRTDAMAFEPSRRVDEINSRVNSSQF